MTLPKTPDVSPANNDNDAKVIKMPKPRGFAAMDRAKVSQIAHKGGVAAHAKGTAHQFTSEEARIAGRLGGKAMHAKRRAAIKDEVA